MRKLLLLFLYLQPGCLFVLPGRLSASLGTIQIQLFNLFTTVVLLDFQYSQGILGWSVVVRIESVSPPPQSVAFYVLLIVILVGEMMFFAVEAYPEGLVAGGRA
jgi:hypothetical protein